MTTIASSQLMAVIDYLMDKWIEVQRRTEESIRAPKIVMLSVTDLEQKGVPIDEARDLFGFLYERGCFPIQHEKRFSNFKRMAAIDETEEDGNAGLIKGCLLGLEDINCVKLFGIKLEAEGKKGLPIIKLIALEHIARKMAETDPAKNLIKILRNCNLPFLLYLTPNTKGRMLIDFFNILVTSTDVSHHQLLFRIFEEFCHPLHFGGSKERAQEMQDFFSDLLEYDSMYFEDNKLVDLSKESSNATKMSLIAASMKRINRNMQRNTTRKNVPTPMAQPEVAVATTTAIYTLNELQIDLESRVLRNVQTGDERDLSGFNYDFLNTLIAAKGALVSYDLIAKAAQTTVGLLLPKGIMDRKSTFIKMLQTDLHISVVTCAELIRGRSGYRINRKIYE